MQKRVGLARAIAREPEIIFFDEPTTGLDPIMADVINDLIATCVRPGRHRAFDHPRHGQRAQDRRPCGHAVQGKIIWEGPVETTTGMRRRNPHVDQFINGKAEGPDRRSRHRQVDPAAAGDRGAGARGAACAYISGEEAVDQVRLRARRWACRGAGRSWPRPPRARHRGQPGPPRQRGAAVVVIDSIQTMYSTRSIPRPARSARCAPRAGADPPRQAARLRLLLVGHVTKEGLIAGPRVLEHMVDTVLYFEGERGHQFRILRAVKNRFGPTDEIGVFEMTDEGLIEVANPSALFLAERRGKVSPAPRSSPAWRAPGRCWWKSRRWWRLGARHAAPRRGRLGFRPPRHGAGGARGALRRGARPANDVYLNVAGGLRIGSRPPIWPSRRRWSQRLSDSRCRNRRSSSARSGFRRGAPGQPGGSRLKEAAKLGFDDDKLHEECGVFGVFGHGGDAARSPRSACTRCSTAARRPPASSPRRQALPLPSASAWSATISARRR
jgi:hypothetical protein